MGLVFPSLTIMKLKAGIFDGHQICHLIRELEFTSSTNEVELEEWKGFVLVVKNFLGKDICRICQQYVESFQKYWHKFFLRMNRFPRNRRSMSDKQGDVIPSKY